MKILKLLLINAITFLRVVISCIVAFALISNFNGVIVIVALFILTYVTDFLDGLIARKYSLSTKFGAIFDVGADLFFIVLLYSTLIKIGYLPNYILLIVILKFAEFCFTSIILTKSRYCCKTIFVFDKVGKLAVGMFFGLPLIAYLSNLANWKDTYHIGLNCYLVIMILLACVSTTYRLSLIFIQLHNHNLRKTHTNIL